MYYRVFATCLLILALGCRKGANSDLEDYLAAIRAAGMSEGAHASLRAVAAVSSKRTLLTFEKNQETGRYDRTYQSTTCPLPNATPKQFADWQRGLLEAADKDVKQLKPLADFDNSGFVTTDEGNRFRRIYEAGVEAAYICEHQPCTLVSLTKGFGMSEPHLLSLLRPYNKVQKYAEDRHLNGFPKVPMPLTE